MNVLSLTHAHLNPDGLSPVSCERADSITGTWAGRLGWSVDVVYTAGTKWPGIWPGGKGLKINIITEQAPEGTLMGAQELFAVRMKQHIASKQFGAVAGLVQQRMQKRLRAALSARGLANPHELHVAAQWGAHLAKLPAIRNKRYDFIFVCVGYGDEYLLETGHTLSTLLNVPMVVDFRDLWSGHHEAERFTHRQRGIIRKHEQRLLNTTKLISVPQTHMAALLREWVKCDVYLLSHSAYVDPAWADGQVISDTFTMLYAGKLYPDGPGIRMLLQMIKNLAALVHKPFTCRFFVDNPTRLKEMAAEYGVTEYIQPNGWVSPGDLWKEIRSAHLLVIPDLGVAEDHPILPTKTFQYAYSGRQILCLFRYMNEEMKEFLHNEQAGAIYTNVDEATAWVQKMAGDNALYTTMPALRNIPMREDIAATYGGEVAKTLRQ